MPLPLIAAADPRPRLGRLGEQAAARYLCGLGWRVIARNARTRYGELDLVCAGEGALVFVEVKALRGRDQGTAERALQSIGPRKQLQIRRLARAWLAAHRAPPRTTEIRFDAVGVSIGPGDRTSGLVHVRSAF